MSHPPAAREANPPVKKKRDTTHYLYIAVIVAVVLGVVVVGIALGSVVGSPVGSACDIASSRHTWSPV